MYFIAPQQILQFEEILLSEVTGFVLAVHPDFLQGYPLATEIRNHGYFSYSSNEALYLSAREEKLIAEITENIAGEIGANLDPFSHDLLITNLELLLKYCDRFYGRQFLTRKKIGNDLLTNFEKLLDKCFREGSLSANGIPTVQFIAERMNLSPNYLSDLLRVHTGNTTQQHIQNRLIEKAKALLSATGLSVSEIAYSLGFEPPQSFHRLFKNAVPVSPSEFRQTFR